MELHRDPFFESDISVCCVAQAHTTLPRLGPCPGLDCVNRVARPSIGLSVAGAVDAMLAHNRQCASLMDMI